MTPRSRGTIRNTLLAGVAVAWAAGCAPQAFGPAQAYYADQYRVRDGAARRTSRTWFLRFDALTLSDLDDAIAAGQHGDNDQMRRLSEQVLRAAGSLARQSAGNEIDRMPAAGRRDLASRAKCAEDADALKAEYDREARSALDGLLADLAAQPNDKVRRRLGQIRADVEPAPDDKGRLARQLSLGWAAAPAWIGVSRVEADLERKRAADASATFARAAVWQPKGSGDDALLARQAPAVVMEWPEKRTYPADYDRFGEVYLTGARDNITVHVNGSRPVLYVYRGEAKLRGRRYPQLVYTWWYPERPAMSDNDPVAGHIDGDTFRVTLDSQHRPAIFEVVQSCGCGHLVFVAQHIEDKAARQYGGALPDKTLAVERDVPGKRDLIVSGTVAAADLDARPVITVLAGYHEVRCVRWLRDPTAGSDVVESHGYDLVPYDELEHLQLGDGVASMFGPDGLVHNAGRGEGVLLAPTGILSAGQPRKRGTQKIRWDEYSFDDPALLDKALRLPDDM